MRQTNKLFLLLALLLTAATGAWAQTQWESGDCTVTLNNGTLTVSGNGAMADYANLDMPWYNNKGAITSVVVESGVTSVGALSFCNFEKMTSVTLPEGLTSIGTRSFISCGKLTSITIPSTVTSIGAEAFYSCTSVTDVNLYADPANLTWNEDGCDDFNKNPKGSTKCHVLAEYLTAYQTKFNGQVNVTFVGDLKPLTAAPTYTVSLADGVKDADKWTITPNEGLKEGDQVTLTYTGRLKVKGVKATSDAAAPSVPDGALSGVFSVSDSKKVYFSKGNLRYESSKWSFFDNQYDYYADYSADAWDKFGWSTTTTTYGMSTSASSSDYSGDFVDWGETMGAGWFTLSKDEWTYLLNTRTVNGGKGDGKSYTLGQSVNGKLGVVIYPDNYTGAVYSGSDWATFESAGCVFLPAAGLRSGSSVWYQGTDGFYWSATPSDEGSAYHVYFVSDFLDPASYDGRSNGCSVRLVREVATSDAEPAGNSVDLSTLTADYEAQNGDVLTGMLAANVKITIAAGASVTLDGVTISSSGDYYCIKCLGDATIILKDGSTNTLTSTSEEYPALSIGDAGTTLTIQGSTGVLNVTSGSYCAGIGGGYKNADQTCGNIRIEGGVITAQGGRSGAGIGADCSPATCGDIIITGGTITAKGGAGAAGIGTGGGTSTAVCGDITIASTVTKVTATKGEDATNSIGASYGGTCGTVTIGGVVGAITESPYTYQPSN